MIRKLIIAAAFGLLVAGCSSAEQQTAARNLLAVVCNNGQTLLTEVPTGFLTPAMIQNAQMVACSTAFGTSPAPASAPGMAPVFPAPSPAATPAPTISAPVSALPNGVPASMKAGGNG